MGLSLMALDALRDLTMDGVTGGTVNGAMPALIVPELSILLRVEGKHLCLLKTCSKAYAGSCDSGGSSQVQSEPSSY